MRAAKISSCCSIVRFAAFIETLKTSSKDKKNKATAPPALPTIKKMLAAKYKALRQTTPTHAKPSKSQKPKNQRKREKNPTFL